MKYKGENQDKKKEIINKYNLTYHFYDERYRRIQHEKYKVVLKNYEMIDKIILDAGCGTGLLLDFMIRHRKEKLSSNFFYVGIDISIKMLKNFQSKIKEKPNNKISLLLADLENLPIRNNSFNSVFSLTSLQNLPNIVDGIEETFRIMKNRADLKMSILKKKIDIDKLLSLSKQKISDLEIIDKENIEDYIVQGNIVKD